MRKLFSTGSQSQIRRKPGFSKEIFFPDWISGSAIIMRTGDFNKLGGFDEDYWMYYEDVDFCRRIRKAGGEIAYCTHIVIEHNHGGSSRTDAQTASITKTEVLISKHVYISKHFSGRKKTFMQIFLIFNNLISLGVMALIGTLLFFVPQLFLRARMFKNLIVYYSGCLMRKSWVGKRSSL
jgi:GT2 family glycosyltransferase